MSNTDLICKGIVFSAFTISLDKKSLTQPKKSVEMFNESALLSHERH